MLAFIYVVRKIFRYVTIKEHPQHILLEVPTINAPPEIIGNPPYYAVQLGPFLFLFVICHLCYLLFCPLIYRYALYTFL